MNETEESAEARPAPELQVEEYVRDELERVRSQLREEAAESWPLYVGIEGGRLSEPTLAAIFGELGVTDLRSGSPTETRALGAHESEEVFQAISPTGLGVRLVRMTFPEGGPVLDLECFKPAS